jgi:1,4-dihydroxy-2-naphthoate octaprenyltransferase
MNERQALTLWQIFRWPLLLALQTIAGLTAALVGDGLPDLLSWLCLGSVAVLMAWLYRGQSKPAATPRGTTTDG